MGTWHEMIRSLSIPFGSGDCITAHYKLLDNKEVELYNS